MFTVAFLIKLFKLIKDRKNFNILLLAYFYGIVRNAPLVLMIATTYKTHVRNVDKRRVQSE